VIKIFADDYISLLSGYVSLMEIQGFFEEIDYNELQFLEVCFAALVLRKKLGITC